MADALDVALADPDRAAKELEIGRMMNEVFRKMELEAFGEDLPREGEPELLTTDDATLRTLIVFLRAGSFRIE